MKNDKEKHRQAEHGKLYRGDQNVVDNQGPIIPSLIGTKVGTEIELQGAAQEKGQADRGDKQGHGLTVFQGTEDQPVLQQGQNDDQQNGGNESKPQGEVEGCRGKQQYSVGTPCDQLPMGEIDKPEDGVDHRQADSKKRVNASGDNTVYEKLEIIQNVYSGKDSAADDGPV